MTFEKIPEESEEGAIIALINVLEQLQNWACSRRMGILEFARALYKLKISVYLNYPTWKSILIINQIVKIYHIGIHVSYERDKRQ